MKMPVIKGGGIAKITGVPEVMKRLEQQLGRVGDSIAEGMTRAGRHLQRESQAIVPVQTGNLKNSAFTRRFGIGRGVDVIVGYTANYAAYVHEDLSKAHGRQFNVKHASDIARAGRLTKSGRWRASGKAGTAAGGMFPRGENQQAKFLEKPAREQRTELLRIIRSAAT